MTHPESRDEDFFVGYLPVPRRLRRQVVLRVVALTSVFLLICLGLSRSTQGAGRAQFKAAQSSGTLGVFTARPTAMLWTLEPAADGGVRGTLLVRQGKFGLSASAAAQLDGHAVRIHGSTIERDTQRMIELSSAPLVADADLQPAELARIVTRARAVLGQVTLTGEIVDAKCYLGRMRPGDRRTHRACAQQCIAGGIPPVFVTRDALGVETLYQLSSRDGASIASAILPFVAEPVEITGTLVRDGDALILQTDLAHVTRL
jgi:hypothetical protein